MKETIQDKRRLERFDLIIPARIERKIKPRASEEEDILTLLTSDICSGGAFFHTLHPLPQGTEVKIDLVLPLDRLGEFLGAYQHASIKVTGTVLRSDAKGMAICFNEDYEIRPCTPDETPQH